MDIKDIEQIAPVSRGSTEIFKTGRWGSGKPVYVEKTSPCRQACPAGIDMARALAAAALGRLDEALRIVREDNPLPGVCGRVCYHPCEQACNRKEFDEAVNIRGFERYLSDHGRVDLEREVPVELKNEKVAVIGSGPAGLSAAWQLVRLGYPVTIFEARPEPGGMLRYGIPEYRLPVEVLQREIGYIRRLGVEIRTGVRVGDDIPLTEIKREYQALFLAAGAQGSRRLGIEGEDLSGVLEGIRFLRQVRHGERVDIGRRVVVIGGGNTAVDCARTARRLGGEEVTILYRRSRLEMPALSDDLEWAEREGIRLECPVRPKRLIAEKGRLAALECLRMEPGPPDEDGRPRPVPIPGSEFILPVETVIVAVGQVPEAEFAGDLGLPLNRLGQIEMVSGTAATARARGLRRRRRRRRPGLRGRCHCRRENRSPGDCLFSGRTGVKNGTGKPADRFRGIPGPGAFPDTGEDPGRFEKNRFLRSAQQHLFSAQPPARTIGRHGPAGGTEALRGTDRGTGPGPDKGRDRPLLQMRHLYPLRSLLSPLSGCFHPEDRLGGLPGEQ